MAQNASFPIDSSSIAELVEFASFASISSLPEHAADVRACADWLTAHLASIGLRDAGLWETGDGHPVVHASWAEAGPRAPTVIVYGHYDVQPVEPLDAWTSPPFAPEVRDGRLYARGASDNKGPIFANLKAIEMLLAGRGRLPCNVIVLIEGEEEYRSEGFARVLADHRDELRADLAIVSDVTLPVAGTPAITIGLRGFVAIGLMLRGAVRDLHSGLFGGVAQNPIHALCSMLAGLHDPATGRVAVDGFYDNVDTPHLDELRSWRTLTSTEAAIREQVGRPPTGGERALPVLERVWSRPTVEVNGIWGGFTGSGLKTVIPSAVQAKLSCRLVPDQDPKEVMHDLTRHLRSAVPDGFELGISWSIVGSAPYSIGVGHPAVDASRAAIRSVYGVDPLLIRSGWSVPAAEAFRSVLGVDSLLLGFGSATDGAHGPDEHLWLDDFSRGITTMTGLYPALSRALRR